MCGNPLDEAILVGIGWMTVNPSLLTRRVVLKLFSVFPLFRVPRDNSSAQYLRSFHWCTVCLLGNSAVIFRSSHVSGAFVNLHVFKFRR